MARIESDSLGELSVPEDAYYGSFTVRAKQNYISPNGNYRMSC